MFVTKVLKYHDENLRTAYLRSFFHEGEYVTEFGPKAPTLHNCAIANIDDVGYDNPYFYVETDVSHVGEVVGIIQDSVRVMSDVWEMQTFAICYNSETGGFERKFMYGDELDRQIVCRATVDASIEVREAYKVWQAGQAFRIRERDYDNRQDELATDRKTPGKGKWVRVVKGRKVPKGTEGLVFWSGIDGYNNLKVGIAITPRKDSLGRYADVEWTAASNCVVTNQPSF